MSRFTIFVGGVHGVGKGRFSNMLRENIFCEYVSASSLLHWATVDKTVNDIEANQNFLISELPKAIHADKVFMIDGHYALWNKAGGVERVPQKLFDACIPNVLICVTADPVTIALRLRERDGIDYDAEQINLLQTVEIANAKDISKRLNVPLFIIDSGETSYIKAIKEIKSTMTEYTRENIYSEMLKTVIIRFDFSGSTSIRRFVDDIKPFMIERFAQMRTLSQNQYTFKVRPKDIEDGSLPIAEQQNNLVYHFFECKLDEHLDVVLDVAVDSVCLTIDCRKRYNGSKKYTDLMVELMTRLIRFDPYINIERIGVRKIDAQVVPLGEHISQYFNENYLAAKSWYASTKEKVNFTEVYRIGRVNFNVVQHIDRLPGGESRAIFDVDAYIVNGDIRSLMGDGSALNAFLNDEVQDKMFEIFVSFASKNYLERCKEAKQNQQNG